MHHLLLPRIIVFVWLFISCYTGLMAQTDSALIQLKQRAFDAFQNKEYDTARVYFFKLINQYPEQPRTVGMSYNNLGVIDLKEGFYSRALDFSERAIEVYRELGNDTLIAQSLYNAARVFKRVGQNDTAIVFLLEAINFFEQENMVKNTARTYNVLANLLRENNDFEKAIEAHNSSIYEIMKLNDSTNLATYINNRGKTYVEMEFLESAVDDFKTALNLKQKIKNIQSSAYSYYNLGKVEFLQENFQEAKNNFLQALNIHKQFKNKREIAFTSNYLGEIAGLNKQWAIGREYFISTEEIANSLNDYDLSLSNYLSQSNFYENKGENKKALKFLKLYNNVREEKLSFNKEKAIKEFHIKYEVQKKEKESFLFIQKAEEDALIIKQKNSSIRQLEKSMFIILSFLILASILGYWFYRLSQKAKEQAQQEKAFAQKEKRFNVEQHHRIKNHLQLLAGLLSFQQRKLEDVAAKEVIQESSNRVNAITTLHQHFYQSDELSSTTIQLDTYLANLIDNLALIFKQTSVTLIKELEAVQIEANKALPLGLICNEIITNAYKYGLNTPDPQLRIVLKKVNQIIQLSIADNGVGIQNQTNGSSIGLEVIQQMAKQIGATLEYQYKQGTTYTLIL